MRIRFPGGANRCLTLSYDDGVEQDIRLIGLMKQYGIAGTFNLNSGLFRPEDKPWPEGQIHRRMTEKMCREVYSGSDLVEVACHGVCHLSPDVMTPVETVNEVLEDRKKLESMFGTMCRGMAYAFGRVGPETEKSLQACGIVYARTVTSTYRFDLPGNWLRLNPTCHHNDPALMPLAEQFVNYPARLDSLQLFYLWGHAYEFEERNNWDVIETFFQKVAHHPNAWYATNIQVYTYLEAAKQLVVSGDGKTVYNPTQTEIWYTQGGEIRTVAPGETKTI